MLLEMVNYFFVLIFALFLIGCVPETKVDEKFFEDYLDSVSYASLSLSHSVSGSKIITNTSIVDVNILKDENAMSWCLTESSALATESICPSGLWLNTRPSTFTLSSGEGSKSVYLWLKNKSNQINHKVIKHTIVLDTQNPSVSFLTPAINAFVNNINKSNFTITGTCSENNRTVTISGAVSVTTLCLNNNFNANLNLSSLGEGAFTINLSQVDLAGNQSLAVGRNFYKDIFAPNLTQDTISSNFLTNQNQVTFSGACEDGTTINISGSDSTSTACSSSSWSYQTNPQTNDGTFSYQFSTLDSAGNSSTVSGSWIRDNIPPQLSFFEIADGVSNIGTFLTFVKIEASDDNTIEAVRFSEANFVTNNCDSEYANDNWQAYSSGQMSYSFFISAGDGEKKVCAWAKDKAGNVSLLGNSTGVLGVDMDTVNYEVGNIPQFTAFTVTNNTAGSNFGTQKFNLNDEVLIQWTVTDVEGFGNNPILIDYTTNNSTWISVTSGHGGLEPTSPYTGSFTFSAPTSGYFKIRIFAKDKANNRSLELRSLPLNTGQWSVYAGTDATGVGGSFNSVLLSKASYDNAYGEAAVNPKNGDVYFYSYGKGLYRTNAITGIVERFIANGPMNIASKSSVDATTYISVVPTMKFDKDGNLYMKLSNVIYRINTQTNEIKLLFGGGTTTIPPYTSSNIFISNRTDYDLDLSKNIYFFVDCAHAGPWGSNFNNSVKIAKATYDAALDSYSFADYAGNCVLDNPSSGVDALTNPLGKFNYQHLLSLTVNGDGSLIYYGIDPIRKIYNGVIYSTNFSVPRQGISLEKTTNTLFGANGKIFKFTNTATPSANSEIESIVINNTGSVNCNDDGTSVNSACVNAFHGNGKGNVFTGFNGEVYFVDLGARVRFINPKNSKIYTLMGSKPIYGNGLNKSFLRAQWLGGIYYKKAIENNQVLFPSGLYFTDEYSMTFNLINPATGIMTTLAGNQSLISDTTNGVSFDTSISLGNQHSNHNLASLTFDEAGLPWFVTDAYLRKVEADGKMYRKQGSGSRWSQAIQGSNPANFISTYFFGFSNLIASNGGVFQMGQAFVSPEVLQNAPVMQFHDYTNSIVQHMMGGGAIANVGYNPDNSTPGAQKNLSLSASCMTYAKCFNQYDSVNDFFYFSEDNKLRYITNPKTPTTSTLNTLFDAGRPILNFIFSEDGEQVYYVSTDGRLYCYDLPSGTSPSHCNNTNLGPATGMTTITSRPNQLTWKSSNELLINPRNGEIYIYNVP
jgi:Bacterial Ig-like domain